MKAQLIKKTFSGDEYQYTLYLDGEVGIYAKSGAGHGWFKLSKQNCDEIFGVTDVEKLAEELFGKSLHHANSRSCYKEGFHKAMELNGDKLFTLDDVRNAIQLARYHSTHNKNGILVCFHEDTDKIIQSLQQPTEIEVEIEMEEEFIFDPAMGISQGHYLNKPKLDSEGCLMLKKAR